jgi:DNA-binding response OmpR family regulator
MRILLVEDDVHIAGPLDEALRRRGYDVTAVRTAAQAASGAGFDLVLLDLGLPDGDGLTVCRELRARARVGIIVLTARAGESERVAGLRAGADDYVVKPFSMTELHARIEAVLRRSSGAATEPTTSRGAVVLAAARRVAHVGGRSLGLTRKEFDLLVVLARQNDAVVTRDQLMLEVWHSAWPSTGRSLDVHVGTLRAKLGSGAVIETVRGVGYRFRTVTP